MKLRLVYIEMALLRKVLEDHRHAEFCELSKRSSKPPDELMAIQKKLYGGDIKLGESNLEDRCTQITGIEGSMIVCTSVMNKIQELEDELQGLLGRVVDDE